MEKELLDSLEFNIIDILTGEVKKIIEKTRKNMVVVEEKRDGDSATVADIEIGKIFDLTLPKLLPNSIVIQEESFNEDVYKRSLKNKFVWVVDPIDGTKAFRDSQNFEWCVGVCLLENYNPILSLVYIPEPWLGKSYLLSANKFRDGLLNFGKPFKPSAKTAKTRYVSHMHRDTERNAVEEKIATLFSNNEKIRAYDGHSTLAQFAEVAVDINHKVFTRRGANIWDIIQSAYLIQKAGGKVCYCDGKDVFPLDENILEYKDSHLIMPFTIASSKTNMEKILNCLIEEK